MDTAAAAWIVPSQIIFYEAPAAVELDMSGIARYMGAMLPDVRVKVRPSFVTSFLDRIPRESRGDALRRLARRFAELRIKSPTTRQQTLPVLPLELKYELKRLTSSQPPYGIPYHGEGLMGLMQELLSESERHLSFVHIIFTNQLFCTWGQDRYHLRVALFGSPNLLSTTGLVEAPAKPREFYLLKNQYAALGMPDAVVELEEQLGDRVLRHGDHRLTEVMKGYVMQAFLYQVTGDAFCEDSRCRLFNAHWQEDMIRAQLEGTEFCERHQGILEKMGK